MNSASPLRTRLQAETHCRDASVFLAACSSGITNAPLPRATGDFRDDQTKWQIGVALPEQLAPQMILQLKGKTRR